METITFYFILFDFFYSIALKEIISHYQILSKKSFSQAIIIVDLSEIVHKASVTDMHRDFVLCNGFSSDEMYIIFLNTLKHLI